MNILVIGNIGIGNISILATSKKASSAQGSATSVALATGWREVKPIEIPPSKISWRTATGAASFPSGTNGLETVVLGSSGMVDLEINVLGATDERMHFKSQVIQ